MKITNNYKGQKNILGVVTTISPYWVTIYSDDLKQSFKKKEHNLQKIE